MILPPLDLNVPSIWCSITFSLYFRQDYLTSGSVANVRVLTWRACEPLECSASPLIESVDVKLSLSADAAGFSSELRI